jgi:Kdo2-lipid IVA lauroyltransferase/acyltransferase
MNEAPPPEGGEDEAVTPGVAAPQPMVLQARGPMPRARLYQLEGKRPGRVVGAVANLFMDAVCALPRPARDWLSRQVGGLVYRLGVRRRVVMENLALALPERSEAERRAIARAAYENMARIFLESLPRGDRLYEGWEHEEVRGSGWEALRAHVESGRGALIVTAHFGNWELAGEMLRRRGVRMNALVRPLKGALNTRLVENRLRNGGGQIYPKGAIRQVLKALRLGESVYMLLDQAMPVREALFVPFFGRLASTTPAMAMAAQRTGAPTFVAMGVREGQKLRLEVEGPIPFPTEVADGREALVVHTARVTAVLEQFIRRYPEQWLWLHRRWKVQPPAEAQALAERLQQLRP